jgi:hypothetical protein
MFSVVLYNDNTPYAPGLQLGVVPYVRVENRFRKVWFGMDSLGQECLYLNCDELGEASGCVFCNIGNKFRIVFSPT